MRPNAAVFFSHVQDIEQQIREILSAFRINRLAGLSDYSLAYCDEYYQKIARHTSS